MLLEFTKMHGLGNDFVVVDDLIDTNSLTPTQIAMMCDRNFGIGADGLIFVKRTTRPDADFFMLYHNADGSTAEMCGNGIRCFAKYIVDHGLIDADVPLIRVQTLGGIRVVHYEVDDNGSMVSATVDMGEPKLAPKDIPAILSGEMVYCCPLHTESGSYSVTAVNMGNPHAVIWVDDVETSPVQTVGPLIETHAAFPEKTNVEFAQLVDQHTIRLRVWERGVGETLACGTGACATLVAGVLACSVGRTANVELPGGTLNIRWDEDGRVYMTGPATEVFTGRIDLLSI